MTEETKKKISEAKIRSYEKLREQYPERPDKKRCSQCKEWKSVDYNDTKLSEFPIRKRKIASGVNFYPAGECKACNAERSAKWRENKRAEGVLTERQKEWSSRRDHEYRKRYQRDWAADKRRREGVKPRGPWKKYRDMTEKVPVRPFSSWIQETFSSPGELARIMGVDEKRIRHIVQEEYTKNGKVYPYKNISVDFVDRALVATGGNTHLSELYPHLYE